MIPENRIPTHPGVILNQEFLAQTPYDLARSRPAQPVQPLKAAN